MRGELEHEILKRSRFEQKEQSMDEKIQSSRSEEKLSFGDAFLESFRVSLREIQLDDHELLQYKNQDSIQKSRVWEANVLSVK